MRLVRSIAALTSAAALLLTDLPAPAAAAETLAVNAREADWTTPLHAAVYADDLAKTKALLKAGADVNATNRYGVPPLALACLNGNGPITELLLEAGADPNTTLRGGETVLMTAARTGRPGPVKALLARGARVNAKERRGQTAIMWAAAEGHAEVIQQLIDAGADFRTPLEGSGFSPLFFAVREGKTDAVRVLLKAGADVNEAMQPRKPNGKGVRPGTSPLILAVENGHFDLAEFLLQSGADPNDQRSGFTPLHTLTWVRKPNRGDGDDGDPPPIGSGKMGSLQFVKKLKEHGADVNARLAKGRGGKGQLARQGMTPFMLASMTADAAYLRLLVQLGADPLLGNVDGATPLMAAAGLGTLAPGEEAGTEPEAVDAVKLILELGGDLNTVDKNGETAMHGAAYKSFPGMVLLLAEKRAKIEIWNKKDKDGWTPLDIAEGYRPGNFKPDADTIQALQKVMLAAGITPPVRSTPVAVSNSDYEPTPAKKPAQ